MWHQPTITERDYYYRGLARFASPLLTDWAVQRLGADTVAEARRLLDVLAAHDWYRQRQWFHIEDVCVAALAAGGTFKAWRLAPADSATSPTVTTLTVLPADGDALARFTTAADMAAAAAEFAYRATAASRLLRPDRFNFPTVDGVLLVRGDGGRTEAIFLNVTVSASHKLRVDEANALAALARTLNRALHPTEPIQPPSPLHVHFVWVVPRVAVEAEGGKDWVEERGRETVEAGKRTPNAEGVSVEQWVVVVGGG